MRDAITYHLFSGHAWFTSGALLIGLALADLTRQFVRHSRVAAAARVTGLVACATAALSGTPMPLWFAFGAIASLLGFFFLTIASPRDAMRRSGVAAVLLFLTAGIVTEAPYHRAAPERTGSSRPVVVIGDSLSSGDFGETAAWPELLSRSRPVANLSRPSENVSLARLDAATQLAGAAPDAVVVLEIGGNDMLDGTPVDEFERDLALLASAVRGRDVVMFELPLLPGKWAFGAAQRRVAKRSGVTLIPKRVLARVLTDPSNTIDGLHLTQSGHEHLAREAARWIP